MTAIFKKSRELAVFSYCLFFAVISSASPGDIIFTGYDADGGGTYGKGFSILVIVEIPASSNIYFTDNEWDGTNLPGSGGDFTDTSEGELVWSTGGSAIPVGTTVQFTNVTSGSRAASIGTLTVTGGIGTFDPGTGAETIFAFEGTSQDPTSFLSAVSNDNFSDGPLTNTGLTDGTNAVGRGGDVDVMLYSGSTSCGSAGACLAAVAGGTWSTDDGAGSSEDSNAPDFTDDVANFLTLLPIELLSFSAQVTESNHVLVSWQTASETNNEFFSIERSRDGASWDVINEMPGAGNSSTLLSYSYVDLSPLVGFSYYRMKQTDFDEQFSYSPIRMLEIGDEEHWRVYPNPAVDQVNVEGVLDSEIRIYNMQGQNVSHRVAPINHGGGLQLNIQNLAKGIYIMRSPLGSRKIIKQ